MSRLVEGKDAQIEQGSGNVFADLGIELTPEDQIKVEIARHISRMISSRKLTQVEVAKILDTTQPKVSMITRGRLEDFSVDRLINYLIALGFDLELSIKDSHEERGRVRFKGQRLYG